MLRAFIITAVKVIGFIALAEAWHWICAGRF